MANPAGAYDAIIASVLASVPGAGGAEAAFVDVIAGAVAPAVSSAGFTFPTGAAIRAELTSAPAHWPVVIAHHLDDFVLPRWQAIPATAVAGALGGTKAAWNTPAQIDAIVRKQSDVAFTLPATNSLSRANVSRFDFKLHQLQESPGDDIANGWQLVKDYSSAAPATVPPSAYSSQAAAVQAIRNLAAFEGLCIRLAGAIAAADRAGVSLSETLALWRTEGDLLAPYSNARRSARAPACDVIPAISLGADTTEVFATMQFGLWSTTYDRLIATGLPANAAQQAVIDDAFRLRAFIHWSLIGAGLDFFWKNITVTYTDRAGTLESIAELLNRHHIFHAGTLADFKPAIKADCAAVLDDLVCVLPAAANQRVIVAPKTPSTLVAWALGEALIFAALDTATGQGPVVTPTPKLKYLAYHCQDHRHRTDVAQDKFTLMLVSGAVAAARGPAGALRTSLASYAADASFPKSADLGSLDFTTPAVSGDASGHLTAYQKLSDGGWWTTANVDSLADFILVATPAQWQGWDDLRGNMARYEKLRAYYDALLS
jgi:hypothetical protein